MEVLNAWHRFRPGCFFLPGFVPMCGWWIWWIFEVAWHVNMAHTLHCLFLALFFAQILLFLRSALITWPIPINSLKEGIRLMYKLVVRQINMHRLRSTIRNFLAIIIRDVSKHKRSLRECSCQIESHITFYRMKKLKKREVGEMGRMLHLKSERSQSTQVKKGIDVAGSVRIVTWFLVHSVSYVLEGKPRTSGLLPDPWYISNNGTYLSQVKGISHVRADGFQMQSVREATKSSKVSVSKASIHKYQPN